MNVGDLIEWQGKRWLVRKIDQSTETAFVVANDGQDTVVDSDADKRGECRVVCNPPRDWPFVVLTRRGRVLDVSRATPRGAVPLIRFVDWVKADDLQLGGSVFINPDLRLMYPDRLIVTDAGGPTSSVEIPRNFCSVKDKPPPRPSRSEREPKSIYDHFFDDE